MTQAWESVRINSAQVRARITEQLLMEQEKAERNKIAAQEKAKKENQRGDPWIFLIISK